MPPIPIFNIPEFVCRVAMGTGFTVVFGAGSAFLGNQALGEGLKTGIAGGLVAGGVSYKMVEEACKIGLKGIGEWQKCQKICEFTDITHVFGMPLPQEIPSSSGRSTKLEYTLPSIYEDLLRDCKYWLPEDV